MEKYYKKGVFYEVSVDQQVGIINIENSAYLITDEIGIDILAAINVTSSISEIIEKLKQKYLIDEETCRTDVVEYLDMMCKQRIIFEYERMGLC